MQTLRSIPEAFAEAIQSLADPNNEQRVRKALGLDEPGMQRAALIMESFALNIWQAASLVATAETLAHQYEDADVLAAMAGLRLPPVTDL